MAGQLRQTDDLLIARPLQPTSTEIIRKQIRQLLLQPMSVDSSEYHVLPDDIITHYQQHSTLPQYIAPTPSETVAEYGLEATDYKTGADISLSFGTDEYSEFESVREAQYAAEVIPPMFLGRRIDRAEQIEAREKRLTGMEDKQYYIYST